MINPYAYFDSIAISVRLAKNLGNILVPEIHLFAYLSCLLSLYRQKPISEWQYQFAGTKEGSPFSYDIEAALSVIINDGFLEQKNEFFEITPETLVEYDTLKSISLNASREEFIAGACNSIFALPITIIRKALANDPEMRLASELSMTRPLLDESVLDNIYETFGIMSEKIGVNIRDLMVPAVVWL